MGFKIKNVLSNANHICKKKSPEIALTIAVVGSIAALICGCRATTKLPEILEDAEDDLNKIKEKDNPEYLEKYPDTNIKRETTIAYAKTGLKIARLYAPTVALEAIALGGMFKTHHILTKRNMALAAYAATVNENFDEYRKRIAAKFGDEAERQAFLNSTTETVEKTVVDENGKEKKKKEKVEVTDPNVSSPFVRYFTKDNPNWEGNQLLDENFVSGIEGIMNARLNVYGHVVLNEVYRMLGFDDTKMGMIVGWVKDPNDPKKIKLPMSKTYIRQSEDGKYEPAYVIDFLNLDGDIFNLAEFKA